MVKYEEGIGAADIKARSVSSLTSENGGVQEAEHNGMKPRDVRHWTQGFARPIRFCRSSLIDPTGERVIAFRFECGTTDSLLSSEIQVILQDHTYFRVGKPVGCSASLSASLEAGATGLQQRTYAPPIGEVWVLPNNDLGRAVADSLDKALLTLGRNHAISSASSTRT